MTTHVDCTVTHSGIGNSFQHVDFELVNDHEDKEAAEMTNMCPRLRHCIQHCIQPVLVESHPLTADAPWYQRFLNNFFCPPHSRMGGIIFMIVLTSCIWVTLFSVTGEEALPGGNLFALLALFVLCWSGGYIARLTRLPSLLGMLIVGGVLGNVPCINIAKDINRSWLVTLRQIALTVILTRAGLGLDPKALRRLSFVVLRLAFLPCLTETIIDGIASHLILGFPWQWAFMLGFVIAAVSPAVVVPSLISLGERRYGIDKGIPTLVIAAASLDDILAITGFGVLLGITFSTGDIAWTLSKGPLEVVLGTVYGIIGGIILWYIPQKSSRHLLFFRTLLLMTLGLMAIFTSIKFHWAGAGPLAVLTVSFIAAVRWRSEFPENEKNPVENVIGVVWMIFQPFLFGLIGSEVDVFKLDLDVIGLGIAVLAIGLFARVCVSFLSVFFTNLTYKERSFVAAAWLPKATVQAAFGTVAYDLARKNNDINSEILGKQVLNLAVLSILITAPLGSLLISLLGPLLLTFSPFPVLEIASPIREKEEETEDVE
ncbi:sodium/hydrogen exchanger 9B2-like isoform X4 [Biomphalaria glabrata]|uniref:Sodium/hydrogen exchanger 9B2-like isoform X2 n=2 Tax=Biomphalaria glabrata TaxID=6526 RepID=A0A9W2ZL95_BIOGL|nr:sodium/hydrogen exchanger 9B2-like isoform X2 [Biomphalaria glabrata]XP_055875674.1 sodium/hydrogen exchanger 9B2-like isoform X4 [Biomphalaria glabrata]